jgi:hypothetical protein
MLMWVAGQNAVQAQINEQNVGKYFSMTARISGEATVLLMPHIGGSDKTGKFLASHKRFSYLLQNRTDWDSDAYRKLFPSIPKINEAFIRDLKANAVFLKAVNDLLPPTPTQKQRIYTAAEVMHVAGRFFSPINPDNLDNLFPHFLSGHRTSNGIFNKIETDWTDDRTLLEAFCYEALIDKVWDDNQNKEAPFMIDYRAAINASTAKRGIPKTIQEQRVIENDGFQKMESNENLRSVLAAYYEKIKDTLPFEITWN